MATLRTRFAPSPTGLLHLGHLYAAKFAYDLAKKNKGECLLRFEDIDVTRVRSEFYEASINDLRTFNITFSQPYLRQSERTESYQLAIEQLKVQQLIYPCFCSRKDIQAELAQMPNAPHGPEGTYYPGTCKQLTTEEIKLLEPNSTPCWRFNSSLAKDLYPSLTFQDSIHGSIKVDPTTLGDIILARKDIGTSYHIAVVVDDAFQNITDVTRGEDLLHSTHIHRVLQQALNLPEPRYHHHKIITDTDGNRLAKRDLSHTLQSMLKNGKEPTTILAHFKKQ